MTFVNWTLFFQLRQHSKSKPQRWKTCKHELVTNLECLWAGSFGHPHVWDTGSALVFLIPWEVIPGDPSSPVAGKVSKRKANSERRTGFHSGSSCQPRVGWYNGRGSCTPDFSTEKWDVGTTALSFYCSESLKSPALISSHSLQIQHNYYYSESYTEMSWVQEKR